VNMAQAVVVYQGLETGRKPIDNHTVVGHSHSFGGVSYLASRNDIIFGLNVGCGIDVDHMAFSYGKNFPKKPTLGCGVVLDQGRTGIFVPMDLGRRNLYSF